ncbi:MAG: TIGR03067 domain-containing protein [Fimbriiglobus sp.]|jgi:uncharacterized protein (TIGR03067 family)|nr:TIGR03067 domain-containing protein [Fimbriiglobus sp.]
MTRFYAALAMMVFVGGVFAEDKKEAAKFDPAKVEGKWMVTELTKYGEKADTKEMKDPAEFTKDTIKMKTGLGEFTFKYAVDPKTDPMGLDLEITSEQFKGTKAKGILKLDGDTLKLTYNSEPGAERPTKFESGKDSKVLSFVFTRAKAEKKDK